MATPLRACFVDLAEPGENLVEPEETTEPARPAGAPRPAGAFGVRLAVNVATDVIVATDVTAYDATMLPATLPPPHGRPSTAASQGASSVSSSARVA